jgi:outer membrane protein assembly factor BamB
VSSAGTNSVLRYNGATGAFLEPVIPSGMGGLASTKGLALGLDGNLYVASAGTGNILQFDHHGQFQGVFASGNGLDPAGMVVRGAGDGVHWSLYVSSQSTNNVLRYDGLTGAFQGVFATGGGLTSPSGLTFGPDGNLYVASYLGSQVLRFNGSDGTPMGTFVTVGSGGLDRPIGIAFGPDGNLYVTSLGTNSVLKYNGQTGAFISSFASGSGLSGPSGLAFGPDSSLYVCSSGTDSVLRYNGQTGVFVDAFIPSGMGGLSDPHLGLVFTPLKAPSLLEANVVSASSIRLNWLAASDDETAYVVWRKTSTSGWARLAVLSPDSSTYIDTNLSPNSTYTYKVRVINNLGASDWSAEVKCTILLPAPLAPSDLIGTIFSSGQINLTWTDNSTNETAFAIWRRPSNGNWVRAGVVGANTTSFSDMGLAPNTTYIYRVRAINNGGASAWSDEMAMTTNP